jgi:dinuclear metal center YbgI/SA1388 family protein
LFWKPGTTALDELTASRLKALLDNGISLAGYHLPLDAHPRLGNNALIADALGVSRSDTPFASYGGKAIGILGTLADPVDSGLLGQRIGELMGQDPLQLGAERSDIRTVAICSGGGDSTLDEAIRLGAAALISGEAAEPTMSMASEAGMTFYAAGHYATEVFGIRALAEAVGKHFGIPADFHLLANPV